MKSFRSVLAATILSISILAAAQSPSDPRLSTVAQYDYYLTYEDLLAGNGVTYDSYQGTVGPLVGDGQTSFTNEGSTFIGTYRSSNDYGVARLFARADVQTPREAAYFQQMTITAYTFDPLTIEGADDGSALQVSMRLLGALSTGTSPFTSTIPGGYGGGAKAEFYVYEPETDSWSYAPNQTTDATYGGIDRESIDVLATTTLTGYDPTRRYALSTFATVSAAIQRDDLADYDSSFSEVDAEHTARITGLGFVSGGANATIVGRSGTVYPNPVPEPASLAALAIGTLALLGRRRR